MTFLDTSWNLIFLRVTTGSLLFKAAESSSQACAISSTLHVRKRVVQVQVVSIPIPVMMFFKYMLFSCSMLVCFLDGP